MYSNFKYNITIPGQQTCLLLSRFMLQIYQHTRHGTKMNKIQAILLRIKLFYRGKYYYSEMVINWKAKGSWQDVNNWFFNDEKNKERYLLKNSSQYILFFSPSLRIWVCKVNRLVSIRRVQLLNNHIIYSRKKFRHPYCDQCSKG